MTSPSPNSFDPRIRPQGPARTRARCSAAAHGRESGSQGCPTLRQPCTCRKTRFDELERIGGYLDVAREMNRLHTSVCKLFRIAIPIFQAGMARATTPELVAAVSNAEGRHHRGARATPDELERIREVRELPDRLSAQSRRSRWPGRVQMTLAQRVPVLPGLGSATDITTRHEAGIKGPICQPTQRRAAIRQRWRDVIVAPERRAEPRRTMSTCRRPQVVDLWVACLSLRRRIADGRGTGAAVMLAPRERL